MDSPSPAAPAAPPAAPPREPAAVPAIPPAAWPILRKPCWYAGMSHLLDIRATLEQNRVMDTQPPTSVPAAKPVYCPACGHPTGTLHRIVLVLLQLAVVVAAAFTAFTLAALLFGKYIPQSVLRLVD